MQYADGVDRAEFDQLTDDMKAILLAAEAYSWFHFDKELIITSMIRPDEMSVHSIGRGVDIRSHNYGKEEIIRFVSHMNYAFPYGRGKPTALYHDTGRGIHIHLQSPD